MHTEKKGFFLPLVGFTWCGGHQNQELARHLDLLHQPNLEAFTTISQLFTISLLLVPGTSSTPELLALFF